MAVIKKSVLERLFAVKAKVNALRGHADRCMVDMDPDYYGPCSPKCQRDLKDEVHAVLDAAIDVLLGEPTR